MALEPDPRARAERRSDFWVTDRDFRRLLGDLAANELPVLSMAAAAFYLLLGVAHPFFLEGAARLPMTLLALGGAAVLSVVWLKSRFAPPSPRLGNIGQALIGLVVLADCLGRLTLTADSSQSTSLALALVAGGVLLYHPATHLAYVAVGVAGWTSIVVFAPPAFERASHFSLMIFGAALISVVAYHSRIRALLQLEGVQERLRAERERRRFEQRAREAQRFESLGRMAGGVAHDFNNLLTVISGNADLWLQTAPEDSTGREQARDILEASERAAELTQQILTYSGRAQSHKRPVDLAAEIAEMEPLMRSILGPKVRLHLSLERALAPVYCDPEQICQVVANLVSNSADAIGDDSGAVSVRLTQPNREQIRLVVEDTGHGIRAEDLPRVFDPFFSTKGSGRGLGLAVVHGILRNHGARASAESPPGGGTHFTALFPAAVQEDQPPQPPATRAASAGPARALIVDDEPGVRDYLSRALRGARFETVEAGDSLSAEEVAAEQPDDFDLLVLDLTLPDEDGFAALERIRAAGCRAPAILISGYSEAEVRTQAADAGVAAFLQKPFRSPELVAAARRVIGADPAEAGDPAETVDQPDSPRKRPSES